MGSVFKSIRTFSVMDTTGVTITGSGIVTIVCCTGGIITIDGTTTPFSMGSTYSYPPILLFNESCKVATTSSSGYKMTVTVGLFN